MKNFFSFFQSLSKVMEVKTGTNHRQVGFDVNKFCCENQSSKGKVDFLQVPQPENGLVTLGVIPDEFNKPNHRNRI